MPSPTLRTDVERGSDEATRAQQLEVVAVEVATRAAALVREQSGRAVAAATKTTPTDVVTHTDRESEQLIRAELLQRCPGSSIVGEEYDDDAGGNNVGWIVDPIDGTVNFLYDLPVVSVSIAATIDGVIVAGAVADVHRDEVYSAAAGTGARLAGTAVRPTDTDDLSQALVGTGFAYDAEVRAMEAHTVAHLLPACRDIRCMGSAALNLCWVAAGRLDAFYERDLKTYDYAAGALIAAEAGATTVLPTPDRGDLTFCATPGVSTALAALLETTARSSKQ